VVVLVDLYTIKPTERILNILLPAGNVTRRERGVDEQDFTVTCHE